MNLNSFVLDTRGYESCVVLVRPLAIDKNSIRNSKFFASIKICPECLNSKNSIWVDCFKFKKVKWYYKAETNRVVSCIPITNHNENISIRLCKRNWDNIPIIDNNRAKPTRCFLKIEWWKVIETSNLILHLKLVGPVPLWRNWTIRSKNTILPRISPHLNPGPAIIHNSLSPYRSHSQVLNRQKPLSQVDIPSY